MRLVGYILAIGTLEVADVRYSLGDIDCFVFVLVFL